MALAWKQPIREGDVGLDVAAVKRALVAVGYGKGIKFSRVMGPVAVSDLGRFQRGQRLKVDRVYGPATHAKLLPHFSAYDRWLYHSAKIRKPPSVYLNPFWRSSGFVPGRIDQGFDAHGYGPICAIGDCEIIGNGGAGWPGGNYLEYRLLNGEHAAHDVYVAESISGAMAAALDKHERQVALRPSFYFRVKAALGKLHPRLSRVKAGTKIASFGPGAAPGNYPGIETGWGSGTLNLTRAAQMGDTGGPGHSRAPAGLAFSRFLRRLGVPMAEDPGSGPEYV